jgi:hypothetical protein
MSARTEARTRFVDSTSVKDKENEESDEGRGEDDDEGGLFLMILSCLEGLEQVLEDVAALQPGAYTRPLPGST